VDNTAPCQPGLGHLPGVRGHRTPSALPRAPALGGSTAPAPAGRAGAGSGPTSGCPGPGRATEGDVRRCWAPPPHPRPFPAGPPSERRVVLVEPASTPAGVHMASCEPTQSQSSRQSASTLSAKLHTMQHLQIREIWPSAADIPAGVHATRDTRLPPITTTSKGLPPHRHTLVAHTLVAPLGQGAGQGATGPCV
jgi:hypothetical protein